MERFSPRGAVQRFIRQSTGANSTRRNTSIVVCSLRRESHSGFRNSPAILTLGYFASPCTVRWDSLRLFTPVFFGLVVYGASATYSNDAASMGTAPNGLLVLQDMSEVMALFLGLARLFAPQCDVRSPRDEHAPHIDLHPSLKPHIAWVISYGPAPVSTITRNVQHSGISK
jgi:hypothetical protein